MNNKKKLGVLSLIFLSIIMFVSCLNLPLTSALSDLTTGLNTSDFDVNQGKYVSVGNYDIFAFSNKIVFYTHSAVLAKTWNIPINDPTITWESFSVNMVDTHYLGEDIDVSISSISGNDNLIAVAISYFVLNKGYNGGNTYFEGVTICEFWILNINNLDIEFYDNSIASINYNNGDTSQFDVINHGEESDLFIYSAEDFINIGFGSKANGINRMYFFTYDLYSEDFVFGGAVTGSNNFIYGSTITIPDVNNIGYQCYVITRDNTFGNRSYLYNVNFYYGEIDYLGQTGNDNTYGQYWNYFGGYLTHNITGTIYTDALIGFGYTEESTKVLQIELLRFDGESYFDVISALSSSLSFFGDYPRVLSIGSIDLLGFDSLIDGTYGAVYYSPSGNSGILNQYGFTIEDLNTESPSIMGTGIQTYQGHIVNFVDTNNAGGLIDPISTVGLIVKFGSDPFTNGVCGAEVFTPLESIASFDYTITPNPSYNDSNLIQLNANTGYTFTGYVTINGVNANGFVYVTATGNLVLNNFFSGQTNILTLVNGQFSFPMQTYSTSTDTNININVTLTDFSGTLIRNFHIISTTGSGVTPTPIYGGGGSNTPLQPMTFLTPMFFGGLIITLVFTFTFGAVAGKDGLIAGLVVGLFLSSIFGLFPIYTIIVSIILGLLLVFNRAGYIGGGGA